MNQNVCFIMCLNRVAADNRLLLIKSKCIISLLLQHYRQIKHFNMKANTV